MNLKEYKAKRNFQRTTEPAGQLHGSRKAKRPVFVVQKHAASHLHYDFRLEMGGALKSWAVPKGFPVKRGERRLAVQVEDHPLEYGDFEGTIAEGNYGAGTVMVWDRGTYSVLGGDPVQELASGKLHFALEGKKLKGEWTLVRMGRFEGPKPQWLLLKSGADVAPLSRRAEERSVLTDRSLQQIAGARNGTEWKSNRPTAVSRVKNRRENYNDLRRLPSKKPEFVEPMKALLVAKLPRGQEWLYELKLDGVRAVAIKSQRSVGLVSRSEKDLGTRYPPVVEGLRALPAAQAVLDGEVVALDAEGRPSFQLLQAYQSAGASKPPLFYYAFDLIQLDGKDLTGLPLWQRKAMGEKLIEGASPTIRFSGNIEAQSDRLMREMRARGLEGLVAKKRDSKYEAGRRSGAWVKFKWTNEQEFVIGGYTRPKGARSHFGAILVGYYQKDRLFFAAKVGTGFNEKTLRALHEKFQKFARPDCPFVNLPEKFSGSSGGLRAAEMRRCKWLRPEVVCQVRFAEWTRDHHLRQPAYLGLREDKDPREVVREKAA